VELRNAGEERLLRRILWYVRGMLDRQTSRGRLRYEGTGDLAKWSH